MEFYVNPKFNERGEILDIYNLMPSGFGSNCYVLIVGSSAAVVDPSVDAGKILSFISEKSAVLEFIVMTHGHFDHITDLDNLRDMSGAPAYIHKDDNEMLSDGKKNAYAFFFGQNKSWRSAEKLLENGDILTLGGETIKVISTPGHSKGSICLLCGNKLITGDTIFANGFGRYDLYGGDVNELASSISSLRSFDRNLTIYPGHGDAAKLGNALDSVAYYF